MIGTNTVLNEPAGAPAPLAVEKDKQANTYEVASQWKLMWWKFRKHKLAMIALPIIVIMYTLAAFCEFFSPSLPLERYSAYKNAPPSKIHVIDAQGKWNFPFVYDVKVKMDPYTFLKTYQEDTNTKIPSAFLQPASNVRCGAYSLLRSAFLAPRKRERLSS